MTVNSKAFKDTIGAETIVDRKEGWGHTVGTDATRKDNGTWEVAPNVTSTDATKESTANRVARLLSDRKDGQATNPADLADRSKGYGGSYDGTAGADNGYRTGGVDDIWAAENVTLGVSDPAGYAITLTDSTETAHTTTDTEALVAARTSVALPTSAVSANRSSLEKVGNTNTIGSIVDRTSGFGHTTGSQSDRHD